MEAVRRNRAELDLAALRRNPRRLRAFAGQGGTLANLRGWIEKRGGAVIGAVGLTGKPYSAN